MKSVQAPAHMQRVKISPCPTPTQSTKTRTPSASWREIPCWRLRGINSICLHFLFMSLVPSIWKAAMAPCRYKHCLPVLVSCECLFSSFQNQKPQWYPISCVFKSSGFSPLKEDLILVFLLRMSLFCSAYFGFVVAGEIIYCLENAANLQCVDLNDLSVTLDIFVLTLPLEIEVMADFHHNRWAKIQNHHMSTTVGHNGVYHSHGIGCKEQQASRGRSRTNKYQISVTWSLQCQNISFQLHNPGNEGCSISE